MLCIGKRRSSGLGRWCTQVLAVDATSARNGAWQIAGGRYDRRTWSRIFPRIATEDPCPTLWGAMVCCLGLFSLLLLFAEAGPACQPEGRSRSQTQGPRPRFRGCRSVNGSKPAQSLLRQVTTSKRLACQAQGILPRSGSSRQRTDKELESESPPAVRRIGLDRAAEFLPWGHRL
jgi:hypothetical protein